MMNKWYQSKFRTSYALIALRYLTTPVNVYKIAHRRMCDNRHGCITHDLLKSGIIR
jgi:hypothetical protein